MKRVAVFCGANPGTDEVYRNEAFCLGKTLATENIGLVYGGGDVGLMGAVARGALSEGGEVIGVLPRFLKRVELKHNGITDLIYVDTMHERKTIMDRMSNGAIAMPGGYGTLEEFFEMLTWSQLGIHQKPMALFNIDGFFDSLISFIKEMVDKGFLRELNYSMLLTGTSVEEVINKMKSYKAPEVEKWITRKPAGSNDEQY